MARVTIAERRRQKAQCAAWAAEFIKSNPKATQAQVRRHVEGKAKAAGFDWLALIQAIMAIIAQLFAKD
jgi:hypothetical protein